MIMMTMTVKRIDEKMATGVLGSERKKTQEYMHRNQQQLFNECNMMMNRIEQVQKDNEEGFAFQKMDDISEEHNYRTTKVIDRLIRIENKQEPQAVRAIDLEKRLPQRKRNRTPSMSSEAKREILHVVVKLQEHQQNQKS